MDPHATARCGQRQVVQRQDAMTPENGHQPEASDTPDTALYIASMADELARLAKSHNLEALAYILDMARLEADQISKRWVGEQPPVAAGSD